MCERTIWEQPEGALRNSRIATRELRSYTDQRGDLLRRFRAHASQEGLTLPKLWHTSQKKREQTRTALAEVKGERAQALKSLRHQLKRLTRGVSSWRRRVGALGCGQCVPGGIS